MAQTTVNIRTDEEVKKQVEEILTDLGMSVSGAVNIFSDKY